MFDILREHIPYKGGGGLTPSRYKLFFPKNVINTQHALNKFFIKTIFLYCQPCLSTGSKEIFMKKKIIFFSPQKLRGHVH